MSTNSLNLLWKMTKTACGLAVMLPMVVACADSAPFVESTEDPAEVASTLEAEETPADAGDAIALYGRFKEYLGGTLFVLDKGELGEESNVLVVNASDRSFAVPANAGTPLWAVGQVEPLIAEEIDGLDPAAVELLEGESALYANRITLAPEATDLTANAESFYNQDVTIYGEVEQVNADNTFILEDPELFEGRGVIVIQTGEVAEAAPIPDDAKVAVSGVLRPYVVADLQEEYGLTWDSDLIQEFEAEYAEVPVLVADLITPTSNY